MQRALVRTLVPTLALACAAAVAIPASPAPADEADVLGVEALVDAEGTSDACVEPEAESGDPTVEQQVCVDEQTPSASLAEEASETIEPSEPVASTLTDGETGLEASPAASPEETLDVVYVSLDSVCLGETQQVAFILSDKAAEVDFAFLQLVCAGGDVRVGASNCVGNGVLFDIAADSLGLGYAGIASLDLHFSNGISQTVDFALGCGEYGFQVVEPVAPQVGMTAYTLTPGGDYVEAPSVEEALAAADDGSLAALSEGLDPDGETATLAGATGIVIGLDPGHDENVVGSYGYGVSEEEANLAIALACRDELQTYEGVTVFMTRETMACPAPGEPESVCLRTRAELAAKAGCVVLVSFHLDSADDEEARGVSVWYPNPSVNANVAEAGHQLAEDIQAQIVALGVRDNGARENPYYDEGVDLDYYAMIRHPKSFGMPGLIIEHCFISSPVDHKYIESPEALAKLGVADARGIANYFGLSKAGEATAKCGGTMRVTSIDSQARTMTVTGGRVWCSTGMDEVLATVKVDESIYEYPLAQQSDGSWLATVELPAGVVSKWVTVWGTVVDDNGEKLNFDTHFYEMKRFSDLASNGWYLDYVEDAANMGIMTGLSASDGEQRPFAPDDRVTRAQVVTILYRIVNPSGTGTTVPADFGANGVFGDVPAGVYYTAAVKWAYDMGIVTGDMTPGGVSLNTFRPEDSVTREELAAMLYRASLKLGMGGAVETLAAFPDAVQVSDYAVEPLGWCVSQGILSGDMSSGQPRILPQDSATRAQAAKMLVLFCNLYAAV